MSKGRPRAVLNKRRVAVQRGYDIHTVNAFGVRNAALRDEEFTNFATHDEFPKLIGSREIWIDERLFENEGVFYVVNALTRLESRSAGLTEETSNDAGLEVERLLRERLLRVKYRDGRPHRRIPDRIYDRHYATLPDLQRPIDVWLVEGNLVRSYYKTDYCEGGHGYVYAWVPNSQIWAEYDLELSELPYIVAHEYMELRLMRDRGLSYDRAHTFAAREEYELREGTEARKTLGINGRKLTVRDLPRLTSPAYFDDVVQRHLG
jgi:hypothetical protein